MHKEVVPALGQLQRILARGKITPPQLDGILEVDPGTVARWLHDGEKIPQRAAESLADLDRWTEHDHRVAALALPECPPERALWRRLESFEFGKGGVEEERLQEEWGDHRRTCARCRSNQARIRSELGEPFRLPRLIRWKEPFYLWARHPATLFLTLPFTAATLYYLYVLPSGLTRFLLVVAFPFSGSLALTTIGRLWRDRHQ